MSVCVSGISTCSLPWRWHWVRAGNSSHIKGGNTGFVHLWQALVVSQSTWYLHFCDQITEEYFCDQITEEYPDRITATYSVSPSPKVDLKICVNGLMNWWTPGLDIPWNCMILHDEHLVWIFNAKKSWPPSYIKVSDTVVEPYNATLSLNQVYQHSTTTKCFLQWL